MKKRNLIIYGLLLVGCIPLSLVVTLLLIPAWRWIEHSWSVESIGHSGPAAWCYVVSYILLSTICLLTTRYLDKPSG